MAQRAIPLIFMRGGTSRGPYFNRADLPHDRDQLAQVLMAVIGAGHPLNIDGIGGGAVVTTKVAMLSLSDDPWADVDYFFAQVGVEERSVDFKPTCGNILSGVAPAAIEMGLITPQGDETEVKIKAVNTGARVCAVVQTPRGQITYDGDARLDGVPGTSAPIRLDFMDVSGSATGHLLPTHNVCDDFAGVLVTCMDVAMPMVLARAESFGLSGDENCAELNANGALLGKIEAIRRQAGARMGLGDVTTSVIPKFALLAPARAGGTISARYFTPWSCHPTMAVTGAQCIAACALTPGSIAEGLCTPWPTSPATITIEHPLGVIETVLHFDLIDDRCHVRSASLLRTARKISSGHVFIPKTLGCT